MARTSYFQLVLIASLAFTCTFAQEQSTTDTTAIDVLKHVYAECVQYGSLSCVKPKLLAFLSSAVKKDQIAVTKDMVIVRRDGAATPSDTFLEAEMSQLPMSIEERREAVRALMLDRVDAFLASHDLKIRVPKEVVSGSLSPFIPKFLLEHVPAELQVPLTDNQEVQGKSKI
jgi:hypothetical protein